MLSLSVALIGIEGFGRVHVDSIVRLSGEGALRCAAFADPGASPEGDSYRALTGLGAAPYKDMDTLLQERSDIDAVIIATPLALHRDMAITAMRAGRHVLVEKPPAVTVQDVDAMIRVQEETGRLCAVNFQNVSGSAFRRTLEAVRGGAAGRVKRIVGTGLWNRTERYYNRTPWAGRLTMNGRLVLDGTLMNPFAHLLQNCLLLADAAAGGMGPADGGADPANGALLEAIEAEMYHANPIEGDDTACIRIMASGGIEICVYVTLCYQGNALPPKIEIFGDEGVIHWDYTNRFELVRHGGRTESYAAPEEHLLDRMYRNFLDAAAGRAELYCPIRRCRPYIMAAGGALLSSGGVHKIPEDAYVVQGEGDLRSRVIPNVAELFRTAGERGALLSELGVPWAVSGKRLPLADFREFQLPPGLIGKGPAQ